MRVISAALLACALAAPAAFALPFAPSGLSAPSAPVTQIKEKGKAAKASRTTKGKGSKKNLGGIHPLVGSGDY
jgi:hypothetical protein